MYGCFSSCYLFGLFVLLQCHFPLFTHRCCTSIDCSFGGNRKIEDSQSVEGEINPKHFDLANTTAQIGLCCVGSFGRHQFQILIYIHNVTLGIISFSFLSPKKIFFFCINAKCRRNKDTSWPQQGHILGGRTTIFALQMISCLFINTLGQLGWVNASVWSVAFKNEIESLTEFVSL